MKEGNNNLLNGLDRLSKLVAHVQSLKGEVSIIERDLLLQELRELYMEVLSMDVTSEMHHVEGTQPEGMGEVVAFENIMQDMHENKASVKVDDEKVEVEETTPVDVAPKEEVKIDEVAVAENVVEEVKAEEESPFAPAEPEPEVIPAPEPVMERIEGNQYEDLFEEPKPTEEVKVEENPMDVVVEKKEEKVVESTKEEVNAVVEEKLVEEKPIEKRVEEKPIEHHAEKKHQAQPEQPSLFDYLSQSVSTVAESKPAPTTLADKFGVNRATLESQLEQKVNRHKVSDLRTVININDKFSFMTELFHNNMKAYNDFILKLNAISDTAEALKCVESVSAQNGWDEHSLSVNTFYKILERKFDL